MKNIKNFEQFNEGFFSKIKKALTPTKKLNSIYDKQLNMYNLKTSVLNDGQEVNITHDNKLVGKLESNSSEKLKWGLTFYYYESETPSEGKKYKKPEEIEGQEEQPYAVGKMRFANSDKAIMTFCRWWESNTKSGVKKNPENKVNTK